MHSASQMGGALRCAEHLRDDLQILSHSLKLCCAWHAAAAVVTGQRQRGPASARCTHCPSSSVQFLDKLPRWSRQDFNQAHDIGSFPPNCQHLVPMISVVTDQSHPVAGRPWQCMYTERGTQCSEMLKALHVCMPAALTTAAIVMCSAYRKVQ